MFLTLLKEYFFLNTDTYFDGVSFPINIFILSISIGLCIAAVCITAHRRYMAQIVKQLMRHNAFDEASAVTLSRMHLDNSKMLKMALSRNGQLTYIVKTANESECADDNKKYRKEKIDFSTARFYIPTERLDRARRINESEVPGFFNTGVGCLLVMALAICVTLLMPEILSLLAGF